ncbi:unnamed protein product [Effrenium voratum]|nr:unnamed protein product [Effrenium voratum]CAJ1433520.1 unnamed protein product [Effrenium voratum]
MASAKSMRRTRQRQTLTLALGAALCVAGATAFLRPPSQMSTGLPSLRSKLAVAPHEGLASFDVKAASLRLPLQVWARDVLDRIHGFAVHVGLFCLIEEYARLGLFGGQPASSGQPVTDWQLPLQGLGGELLH